MIRRATTLTWLLMLLAYCPSITALDEPPVDELAPRIATLLRGWDQPDTPGCSIAVVKDGTIIYSGGFGMANLDHSIPNGADTVFRIASVSKHITASCILLLEDEGVLTLDSDIRKWLPEIPEYDETITIRHLLHHTSGLRDYTSLMRLLEIGDEDLFTPQQTIDLIARQKGLNFSPGEKHSYCNSGYFLLSVICQRVSGKTLRQFADQKIFSPLGMTSSHYHDNHLEVTPKRATGYAEIGEGKYRIHETVLDHVGDGGVFTTVEDLATWTTALGEGRLGANLLQRLQQKFTLNDGEVLDYCLGVVDTRFGGQRMLQHGGGWVGFRTSLAAFPRQGIVIICLGNCSAFQPSRISRQIAALVVEDLVPALLQRPDRATDRRDRTDSSAAAPEDAKEWDHRQVLGRYHSSELDREWSIIDSSGTDVALDGFEGEPLAIAVTGDDLLTVGRWLKMQLIRDEEGAVTGFTIDAGGMSGILFQRIVEQD
ncbi:MAG TPA: class A beta-lactamase-related serine hydrolase [Planctomycetes bacterium]|nr:class A beta-lactamase-related serine hydrolase [Planctomycetota bacterium]HIK81838.1 class A beta-lactamase-related serine hydrolase [Planctomycetota bacterium]